MTQLSPQPLNQLVARLWVHISHRRRCQLASLFVLMLLASLAEIISIGAVLPFLTALVSPEVIFKNALAQPLISYLGINSPQEMLFPIAAIFAIFALLAGLIRLTLLWASTRITYAIGADLSIDIYRRTLYQPYSVHLARNSSEIINGIASKTNNVISTIMMLLNMMSSGIILIAILLALLSISAKVAIAAFVGFGLIYTAIAWITKGRLLRDGREVALQSTQVIKSLQEGLGGIRDVLLDGTQSVYCQSYLNADIPMRRAQGSSVFLISAPRFAIEALGMVLISVLAYFLAIQPEGISSAIPVLGALALGAQRMLPALQQIYGAWSSVKGGQASLEDSLDLLDQPMPTNHHEDSLVLPFQRAIKLSNLSFYYGNNSHLVLKNISLTIAKGSRLGLIGKTGSGKSTLTDILMGLLAPSAGDLSIDGIALNTCNIRAWQKHIAHVPQSIFLADSSIAENIAFGVPKNEIDMVKVRHAAEKAQLASIIETWSDGYHTMVGERGARLSGGQRQRIGIARALYKEADVIIFDEATSALDNETESAVMESIEALDQDLTLIIIAHRISTLRQCTQIIELADGVIARTGSYQDIVQANPV
ncbi:ABC transporter ATP-binding protein [Polynucleobacter sp. MWH-Aus1W21]|uniref:ABC transporter ATP-binding protein n=1 Tax=Polynucleobacter sp. MWH-Aus1W21 TaxID=1855880 RepID=UPI001BFCDFE0|nr:ABC transporter ATP-binding protein [Polynucleobacter sp. MWH-Aus1W21]